MNQNIIRKLISLALLAVLFVFFCLNSNYFLTYNNVIAILRDASVVGIIGIGVTFIIITGGIDLSTGAAMALVGMVMANIYRYTLLPIWLMVVIGLFVGLLTGLLNGLIITKLQVPEFIATLSTMGIFRALTYIVSIKENGLITSQAMKSRTFVTLGKASGGLYYVIIAFIILVILGQVMLKYTSFGTNLYAIGSNYKAALLSGLKTDRMKIYAYMATGFLVAIGTVFTTARLQSTTALLGTGLEFEVIAAVVVGGCALSGGKGDIIGTLIGAIFISTLNNGIYKFQINTSYQLIIKGAIIILVVMFDSWYNERITKTSHRQRQVKTDG